MIEGRGGNFDLSARGREPVFGEDRGEQLQLLFAQRGFVLLGEILPFSERRHEILREIFLVHPCELRENLQVAPIARAPVSNTHASAPPERNFEMQARRTGASGL